MEGLRHRSWDQQSEIIAGATLFLDSTDAQNTFEEYLSDRANTYPEINYYRVHGSWRQLGAPTTDQLESVTRYVSNPEPNNCYHNVQSNLPPNAQYAEGYLIQPELKIFAPHAWLEYEDTCIEITPNISSYEHQELLYHGVTFAHETVCNAMSDRGVASPIVEYVLTDT